MSEPGVPVEGYAVHWSRVLALAAKGRFSTSPNPRVGAIVLSSSGDVVGEGHHDRAGGPHAEIVALEQAGTSAVGGTILVNLEPCAHHGRTPPCAEAVVAAGIRRVECSILDPDPRTAGRGIAWLEEQGVETRVGPCRDEAERLNESFLTSVREGRPYVHLKWASSLDGKIAGTGGASRWISGAESRADSMRLREEHDAILVGAGTVLADNPLLTRRIGLNSSIVPHIRIVLDGRMRLSATARIFNERSRDDDEVWLITARPKTDPELEPIRRRGVTILSLPSSAGSAVAAVDLRALLEALRERDVRSILVEGGGETNWSFLAAGLVDRVTLYLAPSLIGGQAPSAVSGLGCSDVSRLPRLSSVEVASFGEDLRVTGRLSRPISLATP